MAVAFRFLMLKEEDNFEGTYSFFYDFPAELQVYGNYSAHKEILIEFFDIFNDTLAKWYKDSKSIFVD